MKRSRRMFQLLVFAGLAFIVAVPQVASALPSFARQTGLSCFACHTVYPELTPFGRDFKLRGYVLSKTKGPFQFPPPLAGMIVASVTHTDTRVPQGYYAGKWSNRIMSGGNDVLNVPEEANLYYAGRVFGNHLGAFIQGTYEGDTNSFHLDMTDIRFAGSTSLAGKGLVYGITVNNSPTMQDLWNTTPAWGYPFEGSEVAPAPAAASIIDGTLDQQVGGIGIYGLWNQLIYGEFSVYHTTKGSIAHPLGAGTNTDMIVHNLAPYWRLVLQHLWGEHYLSVGTYGMAASIFPSGKDSGPTDRFTDIAFDAEYQYLAGKNSLTAGTTWIHEKQHWDASYPLGIAGNRSDTLRTFKFNVDDYYNASFGHIGGSAAYFSTTGSSDDLLYSPGPVDGSRNGSPNSNGFILEADYLPVDTLRLGLQYTIYNKFNGASSNYDGSGRNASDNNTLYLAATLML